MNTYPRETTEFQPVTVRVDSVTVTTGIQFAITARSTRPTTWTDAVLLGGKTGVMITGLAVGLYRIWAKVTSSPETPVLDCGLLEIT